MESAGCANRTGAGFGPVGRALLAGFLACMTVGLLAGCGNKTTAIGGGGGPPPELPKAHIQPIPPASAPSGAISASSLLALAGDTLFFDPSGSSPAADLVRFVWDFRYDGVTLTTDYLASTPEVATISYAFPGTYTIALQVTDTAGATDLSTFRVYVGDPGQTLQLIPATLDFGTPEVGERVEGVVYVFNSGTQTVRITGVTPDRDEVIPGTLPASLPVDAAEAVPIPVDFLSYVTDTLTGALSVHVEGLSDLIVGYEGTARPGFAPVGPMIEARKFHTATRLQDGRVLIVGGEDTANRVLSSVEIYDPATRTFLPGPSLDDVASPEPGVAVIGPRSHHTATLLSDGSVLVAGGTYVDGVTGEVKVHTTGVVFDPVSEEWSYNFRLADPRTQHVAARVVTAGGQERVLLVGGKDTSATLAGLDTVEVLTGTGAYIGTGILAEPRLLHGAVTLDNHRVLIAGGRGPAGAPTGAAGGGEIFDLDTFTSTALPMDMPRYELTLNRVGDGAGGSTVLGVGGGQLALGAVGVVSEQTPTGLALRLGRLADPRRRHVAVDLGGGRGLLVVGGIGPTNLALDRAEIVAPGGASVRTVSDRLSVPRGSGHRATLLTDGSVLVTGGVAPGLGGAVDNAELYVPAP